MLDINQVMLKDVSLTCNPAMWNFNSFKDHLNNFSYAFTMSKVYAIVSEPGKGGWALSYLLSGKTKRYKGLVNIDGNSVSQQFLKLHGWYVGEGLPKKNILSKEMTIREQLESSLSSRYSINELINLFELAPSRMDRTIKFISNERWNASTAIGLVHGKRIFCFPWLEDSIKNLIRGRLRLCSEIIKNNNCMMIIPVQSASIVEEFVDEIIYI